MSSRVNSVARRGNVEPGRRIAKRPARLEAVNEELRVLHRQQSAVASPGEHAIRDRDLTTLMDEAVTVTATTAETTLPGRAAVRRGPTPTACRAS